MKNYLYIAWYYDIEYNGNAFTFIASEKQNPQTVAKKIAKEEYGKCDIWQVSRIHTESDIKGTQYSITVNKL